MADFRSQTEEEIRRIAASISQDGTRDPDRDASTFLSTQDTDEYTLYRPPSEERSRKGPHIGPQELVANTRFGPQPAHSSPHSLPHNGEQFQIPSLGQRVNSLQQSAEDIGQSPKVSWWKLWKKNPDNPKVLREALDKARAECEEISRLVKNEADRLNTTGAIESGRRFPMLYNRTQRLRQENRLEEPQPWVNALMGVFQQVLLEKSKTYSSWQSTTTELHDLRQSSQARESELKECHNRVAKRLNMEIRQLESKVRTLEDQIELLEGKKESLKEACEAEKIRFKQHFDDEWYQREREHRSEMTTKDRDHLSEMTTKERDFKTEVGRLSTQHKAQVQKLKEGQAEEQARLVEEYENREKELERQWQAKEENLMNQIESLNRKLLKRDRFTQLSDAQLQQRMENLADEVKSLARLDWTHTKHWEPRLLKACSPRSQKVLKRQILQDTIWVILQSWIFDSPFRVLGVEGEAMDEQWVRSLRVDNIPEEGGFVWPSPSQTTEEQRYTKIRRCLEYLKQSRANSQQAALQHSCKSYLEKIQNELKTALEDFCELDEVMEDDIDKLVNAAAEMWLDFGTQRCRIVISIPGSNLKTQEERARAAYEGTLMLTLAPTVKRLGDSKGHNYDVIETLSVDEEDSVARVAARRKTAGEGAGGTDGSR